MQEIKPVDPALVDEAESGECRSCGRDFLFIEDALAHVTTRPCLPEDVARHEAYLLRVVAGQLSPFDEPLGLV